jgi:hypothetical protein
MVHALFAGSKKQRRLKDYEDRQVKAMKKRLGRIYELARLIKTEDELDTYLAQIEDDAVRAETKNLLQPFLLFECQRVELVGYLPPEKRTRQPLILVES